MPASASTSSNVAAGRRACDERLDGSASGRRAPRARRVRRSCGRDSCPSSRSRRPPRGIVRHMGCVRCSCAFCATDADAHALTTLVAGRPPWRRRCACRRPRFACVGDELVVDIVMVGGDEHGVVGRDRVGASAPPNVGRRGCMLARHRDDRHMRDRDSRRRAARLDQLDELRARGSRACRRRSSCRRCRAIRILRAAERLPAPSVERFREPARPHNAACAC